MTRIDCRTQDELDAALKRGDYPHLVGDAHFTVRGSATVRASDSATVWAAKHVPVQVMSDDVTVTGGVLISIRRATTVEEWCDHHGVEITGEGDERGVALSTHPAIYEPIVDVRKHQQGNAYTRDSKCGECGARYLAVFDWGQNSRTTREVVKCPACAAAGAAVYVGDPVGGLP